MKKKRSVRRREKMMREARSLPEGVAYRLDGVTAAILNAPYQAVRFKTGAHQTRKDRPRDNNWRKWDYQ